MVKHAIICEGKNDKAFFEQLISHLQLNTKEVQFFMFKGKSYILEKNHDNYKELIQHINSNQIDKLLFIVDSDDSKNDTKFCGYKNTQSQLDSMISELGFNDIAQTYICCDPNTQIGYLESLLLSTIPEDQQACIRSFLDCSQFTAKEHHKAIWNQIYSLAYPNAPYDFSHPHFNELKDKVYNLFNKQYITDHKI